MNILKLFCILILKFLSLLTFVFSCFLFCFAKNVLYNLFLTLQHYNTDDNAGIINSKRINYTGLGRDPTRKYGPFSTLYHGIPHKWGGHFRVGYCASYHETALKNRFYNNGDKSFIFFHYYLLIF